MEKVEKKKVFVVTRRGRRVEPQNYITIEEAQVRANCLKVLLKQWSPSCVDKVGIIHTSTPNTIC